jgi:trans-aconitate 2-methyltransferase
MYKWNAEDYYQSSSPQQRWARELIEKLHFKGNERVLDIGSGDGKVTVELAERVSAGSVLGIDSSEEMVRFARERFPRERFPNLTFERKDAQFLDFDEEFDIVFSNATLHWVIDHLPVIGGISGSLRSGGRVLLQMGGKGNATGVIRAMEGVLNEERWAPFFVGFPFPYGFYGPEEYKGWLLASGMEPVRVELIPKDIGFQTAEDLMAWLRTTWLPYTQRVPEDRRGDFVKAVAGRYTDRNPSGRDGKIHVSMIRLEVEAIKSQPVAMT